MLVFLHAVQTTKPSTLNPVQTNNQKGLVSRGEILSRAVGKLILDPGQEPGHRLRVKGLGFSLFSFFARI